MLFQFSLDPSFGWAILIAIVLFVAIRRDQGPLLCPTRKNSHRHQDDAADPRPGEEGQEMTGCRCGMRFPENLSEFRSGESHIVERSIFRRCKMNEKEQEKNILVDDRLSSYGSFFDPIWAGQIHQIAKGTSIEESVLSLCLNWKAANNTQALPSLVIQSLYAYQFGFLNSTDPELKGYFLTLAEKIGEKLKLNYKMRKEFQAITNEVIAVMDDKKEEANAAGAVKLDVIWHSFLYLENREFPLAIWGSQRICYGAIFHAYEDFVRDVISVAKKRPNYSALLDVMKNDCTALFGTSITDYCLSDEAVEIARKVRNRLAHNGGKISQSLRTLPHGIAVNPDDVLQIMPENNRHLFDLLKVRALKLTEEAVKRI